MRVRVRGGQRERGVRRGRGRGPVRRRVSDDIRATLVRDWFNNHNHFTLLYLPPYNPFLNAIEEFFSAWRWKVYDWQPHARMTLLQAMEEACGDIEVGSIQGWIRHTRQYFPRCLACEDIACDVDEDLWPDPNRRRDP